MICLSFDIEEFDLPQEHGYDMPFERMMEISRYGTNVILDTLRKHGVKATFFVTVNFAEHAPEEVSRIINEGHELASHGMNHTVFNPEDLLESRLRLEQIIGKPVHGYRMARMMKVDEHAVSDAGYLYESSLNPTFIPGRYNNFTKPRNPFWQNGVIQMPVSVTPWVRFPLFWLAAHVLPPKLYRSLADTSLKKDGYFFTYFHPWEFYDLNSLMAEIKLPAMIRRNSGEGMHKILDGLISHFKDKGEEFSTIFDLYNKYLKILDTGK